MKDFFRIFLTLVFFNDLYAANAIRGMFKAPLLVKPSSVEYPLNIEALERKYRFPKNKNNFFVAMPLGVAYYRASDYAAALNTLAGVKPPFYIKDYYFLYLNLSGCYVQKNPEKAKKNIEELYKLYGLARKNIVDLLDKELPKCEMDLAQRLTAFKQYDSVLYYYTKARDKGFSDLEQEFNLLKSVMSYDRKLVSGFIYSLLKRFPEQAASYIEKIDGLSKNFDDIVKTSSLDNKTNLTFVNANESGIWDGIIKANSIFNYSRLRDLFSEYLSNYNDGVKERNFYDISNNVILKVVGERREKLSYFEEVLKKYDEDQIQAIASKLWQDDRWEDVEYLLGSIVLKRQFYSVKSLYLLGAVHEDSGEYDDALNFYAKVVRGYPGNVLFYSRSLFKLGWLEMLKKNYQKSNEYFSRYINEGLGKIDWDADAALFFKARNLKELGATQDVIAARQELLKNYPYSFYSCISRNELGISLVNDLSFLFKQKTNFKGKIISPDELLTIYTAIWLVRSGLLDEAASELSNINPFGLSPEYSDLIASIYKQTTSPNQGIAISSKLLVAYNKYLSKEHLYNHFPLLYLDLANNVSTRMDIAPFITLSVARRESAFNANTVSPKGATGLMQILPSTAEALDKNAKKFSLTDPKENIRLGSLYLKNLSIQYKGNLVYAFSEYNAGPAVLKRWIRWYEKRGDIIQFIENIPYKETREYVKALIKNLYFYNAIYNKKDVEFSEVAFLGGNNGK